jgi:flagellar biosynthetic protein FlhB
MAENLIDRTEAPTPRRRREARAQGRVARSNDLVAACMLAGFLVLLPLCGPRLLGAMQGLLAEMLSPAVIGEPGLSHTWRMVRHGGGAVLLALAPVLGGALLVAAVSNIGQVGFRFRWPRRAGGGWLWAKGGAARWPLDILKLAAVAAVATWAMSQRLDQVVGTQDAHAAQAVSRGGWLVWSIALRLGVVMLILGGIDYAWQRYRLERQLRMTPQEIKDERRLLEGDPTIKARRKQVAARWTQQNHLRAVSQADLVLTDRAGYAVALKYDPATMQAPRLLAKARGAGAVRLCQMGRDARVALMDCPLLTRALWTQVENGQDVPPLLYAQVAQAMAQQRSTSLVEAAR